MSNVFSNINFLSKRKIISKIYYIVLIFLLKLNYNIFIISTKLNRQ